MQMTLDNGILSLDFSFIYFVLTDQRVVGLTCFKGQWTSQMPNLLVARPMTDLCWACQKNTHQLQWHQGLTMEEKAAVYRDLQEHQAAYTKERSYYNHCVSVSKMTAKQLNVHTLKRAEPNSMDFTNALQFWLRPAGTELCYIYTYELC